MSFRIRPLVDFVTNPSTNITSANFQVGNNSTLTDKCVSTLLTAGDTISKGHVLKIIDNGSGEAVVVPVDNTLITADEQFVGVVGIAKNSALSGQPVDICIGGISQVMIEDGHTTAIGEICVISNSQPVGTKGRVTTVPAAGSDVGFGVVLDIVTGNSDGSVFAKVMYVRGDTF
jgi:hypothetical protein